jgi:polyisoprenoid-binding protein YceI
MVPSPVRCLLVFCSPALVLVAALALRPAPLAAAELRVDPGRSTLLVRLAKDGPASAFAHDHVVRATRFSGVAQWDPARPAATSVRVEVEAGSLVADEPGLRRRLGMTDMSEGTRTDVQRTMVGARQLDVTSHPRIAFRSTAVEAQGEGRLLVRGELTLHGQTRPVTLPVTMTQLDGGALRGRGTLRLRQSEYGISPYRFAFGAVRNRDAFELVLDLVLEPEAAPASR